MLTCLRVHRLAIVDELELPLGPGLSVVTGETGAGKSILVDALGLVLGERASADLVRGGDTDAEVEALFDLASHPAVRARLAEAGIASDGELAIRRVVRSEGRGRAYANGRLVGTAELAALTAGLVDVSAQHEHHSLADPVAHLDHLDAFARLGSLRSEMADAHSALGAADAARLEARGRAADRGGREDFLRFVVGEIDALAPAPGEDTELAAEAERLRHAEAIARAAAGAEEALSDGDESAAVLLARAAQELLGAARHDPRLGALAERIDAMRAEMEDVAREAGAHARAVQLDDERLASVEERLAAIRRVTRKHGGTIESALAARDEAAREIAALSSAEDRMAALEQARGAALERAREVARGLRVARRRAAKKLGQAITAELVSLGMKDASIDAAVQPLPSRGDDLVLDGSRIDRSGCDRVELLFAPNRGEQARPLRKIASGGELSRALLAVKRVLAGLSPSGLYVFDEVDAGVGGAVAEVIGRKLRDVARHHQVLCVTHLPQIAAFGDAHFQVEKHVVKGRTKSAIRSLGTDERLDEIARMLGGLRITRTTRAAAAELIEHARAA